MGALLALWALVPTKDKLYGLLVVGLIVFGLFAVSHERSVGATRLATLQAKLATIQATQAAAKTATGLTNSTTAEVHYVSTINAVIPDSPHLLVLDSGAAASAVCTAGYPTERDSDPAESTVEHTRDIGPDLDKIGRDSDAQVTYLQALIKSCVDIGACKLTP